jgi:hypothetical protein
MWLDWENLTDRSELGEQSRVEALKHRHCSQRLQAGPQGFNGLYRAAG